MPSCSLSFNGLDVFSKVAQTRSEGALCGCIGSIVTAGLVGLRADRDTVLLEGGGGGDFLRLALMACGTLDADGDLVRVGTYPGKIGRAHV